MISYFSTRQWHPAKQLKWNKGTVKKQHGITDILHWLWLRKNFLHET